MRPVFIIAGGPSVELSGIRLIARHRSGGHCRVIAVNDAVYPCWFADHLHASDCRWWIENGGVKRYPGRKTSVEITPFSDVEHFEKTGDRGFDPTEGKIRTGQNSAFQAVHIAAAEGETRIVLYGVDFTDDGARAHWFGHHKPGMDKRSDVKLWREMLRELTEELRTRGVVVMNASPESTITWLPRFDLGSLDPN